MDGSEKGLRQTRKRNPPSKAGRVRCIGPCGRYFMSPDRLRIHKCAKCTQSEERLGRSGERDSIAHVSISELQQEE